MLVHRIHKLIEEAQRSPFSGLGKPERFRHHLSGYWSRRINIEHRMVYQVMDDAIYIVQLRLHY